MVIVEFSCKPLGYTGPKIGFPVLGNVQYGARFHVEFSETEGNLHYTVQFPLHFPQRRVKEMSSAYLYH